MLDRDGLSASPRAASLMAVVLASFWCIAAVAQNDEKTVRYRITDDCTSGEQVELALECKCRVCETHQTQPVLVRCTHPTQQLANGTYSFVSNDDELSPDEVRELLDTMAETGRAAMQRGALERAETIFRGVLGRDPGNVDALDGLATLLLAESRFDEAIELLEQGTELNPGSAQIAMLLGRAYLHQDDNAAAMGWLEEAYWLGPNLPDVGYWLGTSYLRCRYPMSALDVMHGAPTSSEETEWAQQLVTGAAFGQLALQNEASGYFSSVADSAAGTSLVQQALDLQTAMDDSLFGREYVRGSIKATSRYDDNPGVVPTANVVGAPLISTPTAGNLFLGRLEADLWRDYNHDLTGGVTFYNTQNYRADDFDLLDGAAFLSAQRRVWWRCQPTFLNLRFDYDYLAVGRQSFLQRGSVTPSVTRIHDDRRYTTLLGRYQVYDFKRQGIFNGTALDADSDNLMVGFTRAYRAGCNRKLTLSLGYQFDANITEGSDFDYTGHRFQAGVNWRLPVRDVQLNVAVEYYLREYANANSLLGARREDKEFLAYATLLYPLHDQLFLTLDVLYDNNDSSLFINQFHRYTIELGLEYRFPHSYSARYWES